MKEVKDNRLVKKTIPLNSNKLSLILSYLSLYDKLTSLQVSFSFRSGSLIAISNYHILQDFSSITDISDNDFLENDSGLGSSNAIKLVERFKFKSFHVNRHYGNLIRYIMNTPINVSYLSVYELPSCNEVNLFGVSSIKSSVKEIDLSYEAMTSKNKQVYDDFITNFLNECFSLKVLKLKSFNMGEVTFPKLENFPDLESLSLEDVTLVSSSHQYDYLYRVKSLTKLAIVKVNPYTIKDHNKESICEHLFKLGKVLTNNKENLRELFLSGITVSYFLDLNHHFPKSIFNSCFSELESSITELQSLQSLSLSNIMLSSPGDVSRLLNSLPCLEKVVLNNIKYNSFFQNKEDIIQFLQKIFSIKDVSLDNNSVKTYFRFEEFNESLLKNALIDYNENQFKKATENTKPTSSNKDLQTERLALFAIKNLSLAFNPLFCSLILNPLILEDISSKLLQLDLSSTSMRNYLTTLDIYFEFEKSQLKRAIFKENELTSDKLTLKVLSKFLNVKSLELLNVENNSLDFDFLSYFYSNDLSKKFQARNCLIKYNFNIKGIDYSRLYNESELLKLDLPSYQVNIIQQLHKKKPKEIDFFG